MAAQSSKASVEVTFYPQQFEAEISAVMSANGITRDSQWQSLVDPIVDGVVNGWSATAAQKTAFKALFKAIFHALRVNLKQ